MSVPGFTAERSLVSTRSDYCGTVGLNPSAGLGPAAVGWCGKNCYQVCGGDASCLALCLNFQRFCQPDPCLATCAHYTGKQYLLCLRLCHESRCYSDCVSSTGQYAPPNNMCAGNNDPYCDYNCSCICFGQPPGCTPV
jgi:hypothetical protein